ncbi:Proliferation-associated protein 2G4 [Dinochytrium kinnereticum]|nr:Proliferation-associated protein 2G4 [Dinochytrium kinnereticum]
MSRVYTLGPTFRAEKSQTQRHLAEFWMLEAEAAFMTQLDQLLELIENCIRSVTVRVLEDSKADLEQINGDNMKMLHDIASQPFHRITYSEALEIVQKSGRSWEYPVAWGSPLQSEHERYLVDEVFGRPVFVTKYPRKCKPFYMLDTIEKGPVEDRDTVECTDLLVPGIGELVGGSLREHREDSLRRKLAAAGMDAAEYQWYLDLRSFGGTPHGGFGLGLERYLMLINLPAMTSKTAPPKVVEPEVEDEIEEKEEDENDLTPDNVTKYQTAAEIANRALTKVIAAAVEGAKVIDLCNLGDQTILEGTKAVYAKKKTMMKGIAFPTCVSPASVICHLCPIAQDANSQILLKDGDMVRIELAAHIDGYIAQVAHTIVVGANKESKKIEGKKADVIQAAYLATEAAIRMLKPGKTNYDITDAVQKIATDFGCTPVEGMMSNQLQRNNLEGAKKVILNPTEAQRKEVESITFEEGEVYTLDMLVSTGDGKPKTTETRTTVFRRTNASYALKTAAARTTLSTIKKDFGTLAFSLRQFADESKARMGLVECTKHGLVTPYPVFHEKEENEVAHFLITVLLLPSGPLKITSGPWDAELVKSEKSLQDETLKELLKQPVRANKASKKKKKKAAGGADE